MILGQLKIGARQTKNAALMTMMVVVMVLVIFIVTVRLVVEIILIVTGTEEEIFQISYE